MTLFTYVNQSPTNYVHKALTQAAQCNGVLREPCDILNPVVEVDLTALSGSVNSIGNYAYIQKFGRYYYVNNIEYQTNTLAVVYMHVDVLMSHWTKIQTSVGVANRTADPTKAQTKIEDGMIPFSSVPKYVCYTIPSNSQMQFVTSTLEDNFSYIVTVASPAS